VERVEDGEPLEQAWVPLDASPSFDDDEVLIATWRSAFH